MSNIQSCGSGSNPLPLQKMVQSVVRIMKHFAAHAEVQGSAGHLAYWAFSWWAKTLGSMDQPKKVELKN